jgi:sugar lactone lactonase YvrE
MIDIKCEWQIEAALGEGPLWVAPENALYWVDIINQLVHRLSLEDNAKKTSKFDTEITSLALRSQGGFVATISDGFAFIDFDTLTYAPIALPEANMPDNLFNDGKIDNHGRYWAGSKHLQGVAESGSLYRLDPDLSLHLMDQNYIITNGPAFSVDGKTIYHTDSVKGIVYAFDCNQNGDISNKRPFIQITDKAAGVPDGMTVDSENCLWLCHFGGARITRYSPQGTVLHIIPMPAPNITSCAFGGPNLDTLYITTARIGISPQDLPQYPLAGSLFSFKPGVTGLPTPAFAG